MPEAGTVGGAASAFGDFMQGILQGKATKNQQESQEKSERQARVGQLFTTAERMRQDALNADLQGPERDRLYEEAKSLFSSAMALSGQLDDKPAKAGKKQNPFMQFLGVMNPFSDSSRPRGEFDENFSKIVSSLGPGMGMDPGAGATGAAPGATPDAAAKIAGAMAPGGTPATPGGPVGGFSSAMEGEVGGMTAAPTAAGPGLQPRPTSILNADGTRSSERSITVEVAELNGGRPTNIPTIYGGQQLSDEQAIQIAVQSGGVDRETGRPFQAFNSNEEAVAAAGQRSDALGAAAAAPGAAAPGAAAPGATTTGSKYFRDPEAEKLAERTAQYGKLSEIFTGLKASIRAQGIDTIEKLQDNPQGFKIVQELMFLAGNNKFTAFDELDEIYTALGLQPARSQEDQFNDRHFELKNKLASGTLQDPAEIEELEQFNSMARGGQTRDQELWNYYKKQNTDENGVLNMDEANKQFEAARAKEGTQGYSLKVAINPQTQRSELLKVNNRTGALEWTGFGVPGNFTMEKIMTRDVDGYGEHLDARKIRFYHETGDIDYNTLQWLVDELPDSKEDINGDLVPNPEKQMLREYLEKQTAPAEANRVLAFVTAWNSDPANAAPERQITFAQAQERMKGAGLQIRPGSALANFRARGG